MGYNPAMPELKFFSTPLPRHESLTLLRVLHGVARAGEGDYALLRAGPDAGVIGVQPLCRLLVDVNGAAHLEGDPGICRNVAPLPDGQPLEALQAVVEAVRFPQPHPMVGWLGFLSYDLVRFLESIAPPRPPGAPAGDELQWPTLCFTLFKHYLLFDPAAESPRSLTLGDEASPHFHWLSLAHHTSWAPPADVAASVLLECQSPQAYAARVAQVKAYIAAGDIYQANLAQRWKVRTAARPDEVFLRLCALSPAPFAACLRFQDGAEPRHVVSASPELFLAVHPDLQGHRSVVTRPIKGTRPRDARDPARDQALRNELLHSPKDHAELTMIVDLLRNDLGRVAEFGSVQVVAARQLEPHPTVWHTVATITARLRRQTRLAELLAAVCPGGSITGAPKIRAMQIIEELEGFRRGLYCGNIGVIGDGGSSLSLNIAIRTLVFQHGLACLYAGGGIVADSLPQHEYEETLHKAAALFGALGVDLPMPVAH